MSSDDSATSISVRSSAYPISDAAIVCRPRGTVRLNRPPESVSVVIGWPSMDTETPLIGCSVRSSITMPATLLAGAGGLVVWAYAGAAKQIASSSPGPILIASSAEHDGCHRAGLAAIQETPKIAKLSSEVVVAT